MIGPTYDTACSKTIDRRGSSVCSADVIVGSSCRSSWHRRALESQAQTPLPGDVHCQRFVADIRSPR
jgi:hypothetical protein